MDSSSPDTATTPGDVPPLPAAQSSEQEARADLRRQSSVLGAGWLMTWLALGVSSLPIRLLLKNHLHLGAEAIASFNLLTGLAWYFKPIAGLISDSFPLMGTRRRHYLLMASFIGGLSWLLIIFLPKTYNITLWALIVMNTMVMLCSTVLGGLLVEVGKRHSATGRLSSQRTAIMNVATLVAGPVGGFLGGIAFGWTAGLCAAFLFCLVPILYFNLKEAPVTERNTAVWQEAAQQLKTLIRSKTLWSAVAMNILTLYRARFYDSPAVLSAKHAPLFRSVHRKSGICRRRMRIARRAALRANLPRAASAFSDVRRGLLWGNGKPVLSGL